MRRQEIPAKHFLAGLCIVPLVHCSSEHNIVRLYPAKNERPAYRQVSTEHYLYVDENHVAEAERGERRATFVLRSTHSGSAKLFVRLKVYPEDEFPEPRIEIRLKNSVLQLAALVVRREVLAEQVTILESGDNLRTNPTIGNDVQAQSGYITFGKPTGAGSVKRNWQILILEAELDSRALAAISSGDELSLTVKGSHAEGIVDFDRRQLAAWQRFSRGGSDETAGD